MNILVTGGNGQLGCSFREKAADSGHRFVFADIRPGGDIVLDVTDLEAVCRAVEEHDVDVIMNCAAYTDVARAESEEELAYRINAEAVANMAEAARRKGAVLIHVSTDYVFDGMSGVPYKEDAQTSPVSAYGRTKLAGEQAVLNSGCRYLIFRIAWLYSRYGKNFVKTIYEKSTQLPVLKVVCDQVGTPTFAGDLVEFVMNIIDADMLDRQGIYNFTNEGVCSWYDLACEICDMSGHLCEVRPCMTSDYPTGVRRPFYSVLDKSLVKETFGIDIPYWKDSLRFCLAGLIENE